ncbi:MAG: PduL/EutD family phosphate acyltransferase [Firmicutes bacterium]|nr:PduL/EutD family phosphate acyltransferase [Bacillota bacterium]
MDIKIEVSARHVHLSESDCLKLFGKAQLTFVRELSQKGQFLTAEKVTLKGLDESGKPNGREIKNVAVLAPFRSESQVEVSLTDTYALKAKAPIRDSGDLKGSGKIMLVASDSDGKALGEIVLDAGLIVAKRHIHMPPEVAKKLKLKDRQIVSVEVDTADRSVIFKDVLIRVAESFSLAFHIDTDEANAANIGLSSVGKIL